MYSGYTYKYQVSLKLHSKKNTLAHLSVALVFLPSLIFKGEEEGATERCTILALVTNIQLG